MIIPRDDFFFNIVIESIFNFAKTIFKKAFGHNRPQTKINGLSMDPQKKNGQKMIEYMKMDIDMDRNGHNGQD
jgi:hypothetical protein